MKNRRQSKIISIVKSNPVHTHDELIEALAAEGVQVTQATVSRDIKELGIIKVPSSDGGSVYSVPGVTAEPNKNRVDMMSETIKNVRAALHTVVVNTIPGMASAVASAVDGLMHNEILGSVAGDDTIIIIAETPEKARELEERIKKVFSLE